jgi:hypothetical protein
MNGQNGLSCNENETLYEMKQKYYQIIRERKESLNEILTKHSKQCDDDSSCMNDGECLSMSLNSILCLCKQGFYGPRCQYKYNDIVRIFKF